MDFICPRCNCAGIQADGYAYCTRCRANRQTEALRRRNREALGAAPKQQGKKQADENAMRGFNPISQEFLNRRWI